MKVYQDRFGSELKLEVGQFGREAVYQSWEVQGVNMKNFKKLSGNFKLTSPTLACPSSLSIFLELQLSEPIPCQIYP